MNDEEKYLFDLNGFLVLPQVLSPGRSAAATRRSTATPAG